MTKLIENPQTVFTASSPVYTFVKPDLKPGEKKYYEVSAVQVDDAYLAERGDKVATKEQPNGQTIKVTDWVVTKVEADGSSQQWPLWDSVFQTRWKLVQGKPGLYSPRSVPTEMVELKDGGTVKTSWGEASGGPGSFLARYGEGDFNVITATDLVNTYIGTDDLSTAKLEAIICAAA